MAKSRRQSSAKASSRRTEPDETQGGILRGFLRGVVLLGLWGGIFIAGFVAYCALDLPDVHQVVQAQRRPSIIMESADGTVFARYGDLVGDYVAVKNVPRYLPQAIVAIEDRRFYDHFGIDLIGMARAMVRNLLAGHLVQGGSTLTQQLAKNLFLSPQKTAKRKVQEMILALWLEHTYSKDQILTAYLNRVYLGNGAYGVDAAAHAYFDKSVHDIDLREAAIIAGLLRAPSRFAPSHNPQQAMARAKIVLQAMVEEGFITDATRRAAIASVPLPPSKPGSAGDGRYFADWVMDQLSGLVEETAQDMIVRTTLEIPLQRAAEHGVDSVLARHKDLDVAQAALVTIAHDGAIRALVGGRDYHASQYNRVTQAMRQPGSAFKPVVYLAALEEGLSPDDIMTDAPLKIGRWSPENFDGKYRGNVTVRDALTESLNTVAVRVFQKAGADKVIATARALGIASALDRDPALALGASEVTPLELATAYAALAAGGRAITPYAISEIRTHPRSGQEKGQILYRHPNVVPPAVVSASAVETLVGMMQDVVRVGTGKRAALADRPVAGKTGTSSDYRDAWFMGFTGNYTTAIWMGNDDNHPMRKVVGGSLPAQLWHDYMTEAEASLPVRALLDGERTGIIDAVTDGVTDSLGDLIEGILGGH